MTRKEVIKMKLKTLIELQYPTNGTKWIVYYSGCKQSNNGIRQYIKTSLTKNELIFAIETTPKRINLPNGVIKYTYNAE